MPAERGHRYEVLDVFTDTPLQGNPLAVFPEAEQIPSRLMQAAARELNLSETVFLLPGDPAAGTDAQIRIFTPAAELPFAGHPTLGAAFVIGARERRDLLRIGTGAGVVPVRLERAHDEIVSGEMEQPIPSVEPYADTERLLDALGVEESALPVELYTNGPRFAVVTLQEVEVLAALTPDLRALTALGELGVSCLAPAAGQFRTRMFAPSLGVAEDPATGSAAGPLAVHLARHGWIGFGESIELIQGVELGRRSVLGARADGTAERLERVVVGGAAVVVARGHFRLQ